jgi:hypothetical protein
VKRVGRGDGGATAQLHRYNGKFPYRRLLLEEVRLPSFVLQNFSGFAILDLKVGLLKVFLKL